MLRLISVLRPVYLAYLLFQLWSHTYLYNDEHDKKSNRLSAAIRDKRFHTTRHHQDIPLQRTVSQSEISFQEGPIANDSLRRPYKISPLSSSVTNATPTAQSGREIAEEPRYPPDTSTDHLTFDLGGYPMSRESSFNTSGFSGTTCSNSSYTSHDVKASRVEAVTPVEPGPEILKQAPKMSWFLTLFLLIIVTGVCILHSTCWPTGVLISFYRLLQ